MDDAWWRLFLLGAATALAVLAKTGIFKWAYQQFLKRLPFLIMDRRAHDCGHWSESYARDRRTGRTECSRCYRARIDTGRS